MRLSSLKRCCLLAVGGSLWTILVLLFPVANWQARSFQCTRLDGQNFIRLAYERSLPANGRFCGTTDFAYWQSREAIKPPDCWVELSITLLAPGVVAVLAGLVGSVLGCFGGTFGTSFPPSKGSHALR